MFMRKHELLSTKEMNKRKNLTRTEHREKQSKRVEQRNKRRERERRKRRFPFDNNTRLVDLVKVEAYDRLNFMFRSLRPYLQDPIAARRTPYIAFNHDAMKGHRAEVYRILAKFLFGGTDSPLKVSFSAFARFLSDQNHSNFSVLAKPLIIKIYEAKNVQF